MQIQTYVPPPQVNMCRYDDVSSGKCEPMVVPAKATFLPAVHGGNLCTETCPESYPAHWEYSCSDKRRVLVTTESGLHLCILFPDPVDAPR